MFYQTEFGFLQEILKNMHMHYSIFPIKAPAFLEMDLHLREILGLTYDYESIASYLSQHGECSYSI